MRLPALPVLLLCTFVSAATLAQSDSSPSQPKDFATAKAQHLARLQAELTCVQAATSFETMHACSPHGQGGRMMGPAPDQK